MASVASWSTLVRTHACTLTSVALPPAGTVKRQSARPEGAMICVHMIR